MQRKEAFLRYATAKGYVNACVMIFKSDKFKDANTIAVVLPMHMLAGFALELYLKAWLLGGGVPSDKVRAFGHNIVSLYDKARALTLPDVDGLELLKNHLAGPHADFTFRYIMPGNEVHTTNWPAAFNVLSSLDTHVDTFIGASASQGLQPGH